MKTTPILVLFALLSAVSCRRSEVQRLDGEGRTFSVAATAGEFEPSTAAGSTANAFGSSAVQKASRATETAFQQSDRIGLFVTEGASSVVGATGNHSSNVPYRYDAGEWRAAGSLAAPLEPTKSYRATAYSPYKQGVTNPLAVDHEVYADQSAPAAAEAGALELSDLMVAGASAVTGVSGATPDPKVSLAFTHAMAKFVTTFAVPSVLDGADVQSLTSVTYKNMVLNCQVNLATGAVSAAATPVKSDVLPRLTSTNGTAAGATVFYEAIVPPQSFAVGTGLVELKFATSGGEKTMGYVVPAGGVTLSKNQKYTLSLSSIADLAFVSEIPAALLLDGLAHTDIPIRIKSKDNWTLTSNNAWLTVSKTAGSGYGTTVSGSGSADPQTVYVSLAANTSTVLARMSVLTLASTVNTKLKDTYTVNQNYFSVNNSGNLAWSPAAGEATKAVDAFDGNQVIRVVSDASRTDGSASWLRLGGSATYGSGSVVDSVEVVGALSASTWWLHAAANNTAGARTTTVRYLPVDADGNPVYSGQKTQLVTQAAPTVTVTPVALASGPAAMSDVTVFTVTAPVGVRWKLSPLGGVDAAHFTGLTPAAGVEQVGTGAPQAVKLSAEAVTVGEVKNAKLNVLYALAATTPLQSADINFTHGANPVNPPSPSDYVKIGTLYWAKGNLVATSSTASGSNGCKVGAPTDGGLYFQFGSLIGYKGGNDGTGVGQTPVAYQGKYWGGAGSWSWVNEAIVWPVTMKTNPVAWPKNDGSVQGGITNLADYYFNYNAAPYSNANQDIRGFNVSILGDKGSGTLASGRYAPLGVGDPCTFYLGGNWRLPTPNEYASLFDASSNWVFPSANWQYTTQTWEGVIRKDGTLYFIFASYKEGQLGATLSSEAKYLTSYIGSSSAQYHASWKSSTGAPETINRSRAGTVRCVTTTP